MNVPPGISAELSNINYKTKKKMKKTIILASVAIATFFAFSSCQKENLQDNGSTNGVRIITAEFENNATKTELNDGVTPEWIVGDKIRILNATTHQDVDLVSGETPPAEGKGIIEDGKIVIAIPVAMTGDLYAVYPASATSMESCNGEITFAIPAVQDGTFGSANICVAKSMVNDDTNKDNLVFRNATAVLEFSQTATDTKVLSIRVEAANAIVGPMSVSFNDDGTLDTPTTSSLSGKIIRVKSAAAKDRYYIAAAPVTTGKIEFEYQQAVKVATVTTEAGKTLAINKIYTCPSMDGQNYQIKKGTINEHDYVQIGSLKWATRNIGATADTGESSYGEYFMWGAVVKAYTVLSGSTFTFDDKPSSYTNSTWDKTKGFAWENCDFTDGVFDNSNMAVFTKYTSVNGYAKNGTADGKTVLEAADDAAIQIWGSTWRIPTGGEGTSEFQALKNATYWLWDTTDKGYYVYVPQTGDAGKKNGESSNTYNKSDALLFFPAAGCGKDNSRSSAGSQGHYWSSTPGTTNPSYSFGLYFQSDGINWVNSGPRCYGRTVRPVSD